MEWFSLEFRAENYRELKFIRRHVLTRINEEKLFLPDEWNLTLEVEDGGKWFDWLLIKNVAEEKIGIFTKREFKRGAVVGFIDGGTGPMTNINDPAPNSLFCFEGANPGGGANAGATNTCNVKTGGEGDRTDPAFYDYYTQFNGRMWDDEGNIDESSESTIASSALWKYNNGGEGINPDPNLIDVDFGQCTEMTGAGEVCEGQSDSDWYWKQTWFI